MSSSGRAVRGVEVVDEDGGFVDDAATFDGEGRLMMAYGSGPAHGWGLSVRIVVMGFICGTVANPASYLWECYGRCRTRERPMRKLGGMRTSQEGGERVIER